LCHVFIFSSSSSSFFFTFQHNFHLIQVSKHSTIFSSFLLSLWYFPLSNYACTILFNSTALLSSLVLPILLTLQSFPF
jgi:hypothetical protein